jgi:hypothetical protein
MPVVKENFSKTLLQTAHINSRLQLQVNTRLAHAHNYAHRKHNAQNTAPTDEWKPNMKTKSNRTGIMETKMASTKTFPITVMS